MVVTTDWRKRSNQRKVALAGLAHRPLAVFSIVGLCATVMAGAVGCDSTPAPTTKSDTGTAATKSAPAKSVGSGKITGTVQYTGPPVKPAEMKVTMKHSEAVVVSEDKGLRFAVISVAGLEKKVEPKQLTLDQKDCMYVPHVQAAVVGSKLAIQNSDPVLHNVHAYIGDDETAFNLAMPKKDQKIKKKLTDSGVMRIACDAGHTWMGAYVVVFEHPYFAVSDAKGEFVLNDVPVGEHKLELWHEKLGKQTKKVTVAKGQTVKVSFEVK